MLTASLVFIVALLAGMESVLDAWELHQPIIAATLIGVVFGHPIEGMMLGGSLQLITLGWMNVGAAMAPDTALASIASAILVTGPAHVSVSEGIALAVPIAVAGQVLTIFVRTVTVTFAHMADGFAKQGRGRPIEILHIAGLLLQGLRVAIPAMLILALPTHALTDALESIPKVITGGLQVAGGFIVVVGYAMVVSMMEQARLWPFFMLGFALAAITNLNLLAMGIIGTVLALITLQLRRKQDSGNTAAVDVVIENPAQLVRVTKGDQINTFIRQGFLLGSFNYERMQNMGVAFIMLPTLRRLYGGNKEEFAAGLRRHLEFFNTHPYLASPIIGVSMALEEQKANGQPIDDAAISSVKVGMMGPVAGVGDPLYWGTLRPVIGALAASFAIQGSMMGPVIFFFGWNIIRLATLWYGQKFGYAQGTNISKNLANGVLQSVTETASTLGMFMMGVLIPRWTTMNFPLELFKSENANVIDLSKVVEQANNNTLATDSLVKMVQNIQGGVPLSKWNVTTLGDILNTLMPGMMPLALMFAVRYFLKKGVSPILIIFAIFILGIAGYAAGIFGV
jgi:mannose/fructose/sorbose-specific phosphotransferase system IID component/mannose/fructose/sorbose-specific phosphotransferase system IIC component